jgi:hypothetical protein
MTFISKKSGNAYRNREKTTGIQQQGAASGATSPSSATFIWSAVKPVA